MSKLNIRHLLNPGICCVKRSW